MHVNWYRILILLAIMHAEELAENLRANMHFFKSEGALAPLPPASNAYDKLIHKSDYW